MFGVLKSIFKSDSSEAPVAKDLPRQQQVRQYASSQSLPQVSLDEPAPVQEDSGVFYIGESASASRNLIGKKRNPNAVTRGERLWDRQSESGSYQLNSLRGKY
jgi:hypothetical protein